MSKDLKQLIEAQKKEVFSDHSHVQLRAACGIDSGILHLSEEQFEKYVSNFKKLDREIKFFVPASGSGSRMFQFLANFLENGEQNNDLETFFDELETFAFFQALSTEDQQRIKVLNPEEKARFILHEGLGFNGIPKGLIPFHETSRGILNPFQEQVLQMLHLLPDGGDIEFSIQEDFENEIKNSIEELNEYNVKISFSFQEKVTDAFCFDCSEELVNEGENLLKRPSGHGALLQNLNAIDSDLILIKNIDNIQHSEKAELTADTWKVGIGILDEFLADLSDLKKNPTLSKLKKLNNKYQFLTSEEVEKADSITINNIINRPTRVCGMVKNSGAPGGGPFWIEKDGIVSKQIIEKVQISNDKDQQMILCESSHFNPVFIIASVKDLEGNKFDLLNYRDDSAYFVVEKMHMGKTIRYRELPGLWNGSMSNWNTIFFEISSEVFSPVKSVLDLLNPLHLAD